MKNITSIILSVSIVTLLSIIFIPTDSFASTPAQGGLNDNYHIISELSPTFDIGDEIFIFVAEKESTSIYGDYYYIAGLQHGKYIFENGMYVNADPNRNVSEKALDSIISSVKEQRASSTR